MTRIIDVQSPTGERREVRVEDGRIYGCDGLPLRVVSVFCLHADYSDPVPDAGRNGWRWSERPAREG